MIRRNMRLIRGISTVLAVGVISLGAGVVVFAEEGNGSAETVQKSPEPQLSQDQRRKIEETARQKAEAEKKAEIEKAKTKVQQAEAEKKDKSAENKVKECEKVTTHLDEQLTRFQANRDAAVGRYKNVADRVNKIVTELKAQGYDVSKVEADLPTLRQKVEAFTAAYSEYIAALTTTKSYTCGASEGQFRTALATSRDKLKAAKQAGEAVRAYWKTVVRPDLVALKQAHEASPSPIAATPSAED